MIQIIFVNELSESRDILEDVVAGTAGCRREQTRSWDRDIYHLELLSTEEEGERGRLNGHFTRTYQEVL